MAPTRTGIIGHPVAHSLSPLIHQHWAAQLGLDCAYHLLDTPKSALREQVAALRAQPWRGANVTVPYKQAVLPLLDAIDPQAARIGAVNTILREEGRLTGFNTDAAGFLENLQQSAPQPLANYLAQVVILGAGGAARAVAFALHDAGARHITCINRSPEPAQALAQAIGHGSAPWAQRESALASATLLVNTTSLGMRGKPALPLDLSLLPVTALVHDIVYTPLITPLLGAAQARGNPIVDGLGMLLYQAQAAFAHWHSVTPPVTAALRTALIEAMA